MPHTRAYWNAFAIQLFGLAIGVGGEIYVESWDYVAPGIEAIKVTFMNRLPNRLLDRHGGRSNLYAFTCQGLWAFHRTKWIILPIYHIQYPFEPDFEDVLRFSMKWVVSKIWCSAGFTTRLSGPLGFSTLAFCWRVWTCCSYSLDIMEPYSSAGYCGCWDWYWTDWSAHVLHPAILLDLDTGYSFWGNSGCDRSCICCCCSSRGRFLLYFSPDLRCLNALMIHCRTCCERPYGPTCSLLLLTWTC